MGWHGGGVVPGISGPTTIDHSELEFRQEKRLAFAYVAGKE